VCLRIYSAVRRTFSRWWLLGFAVALGGLLLLLVVPAVHAGTLGLAWNAPTTNANGSALTDLSGYRVYTGTSSSVACPGSSYQPVPSPTSDPATGAIISYSVPGLTTGTTYFVQVTAVDTSGNESACSNQATGVAKADGPPTGSLTINGGAAYSAWTAVTLTLTATDTVGVTGYYVSSSATPPAATATGWVAVTSTTSFTSNVAYSLPSGDGTKPVYAWYKDAAGNVSATASASILLDQTPPSNGTLTATAGNGQVALSWSGFTDGGSGLATTNTYKLMFTPGTTPPAACTTGTQIYQGTGTTYTHTGLTNGTSYAYLVCATDKAGNISTGASAMATPQGTDTIPPTVSITAPTSAATYSTSSSSMNLGGTAADNVGVTSVTWTNSQGGSGTDSGTTSWTVSGLALQSGANVLTVTAKDAAGNTGIATLTVTYIPPDTTPPTIRIALPTTSATYTTRSSSLRLAGTASDNVGVTQVTWSNGIGGGTANGTTSWTVNGIALKKGSNVLTVTAWDAAGNTGTATLTVNYKPLSGHK